MADEADSKSVVGNHVWVQVPSPASEKVFQQKLENLFVCRKATAWCGRRKNDNVHKKTDRTLRNSNGIAEKIIFPLD